MAHNPTFYIIGWNTALDTMFSDCDGGSVAFYDGAQPASPDAPVTTQHLLCSCALGTPAFRAAAAGQKVANPIANAVISFSSTCAWFRVYTVGLSARADGSVGVLDQPAPGDTYDCLVPTVTFTSGVTLTVTSLIIRKP